MKSDPVRYVGDPDFHDGYIREVSHDNGILTVTVEGYTGKLYRARFSHAQLLEELAPVGMLLYGLVEKDRVDQDSKAAREHLFEYEFVNSILFDDEPEGQKRLKFLAANLYVEVLS